MQGKGANSLREDSANPGFCLKYIVFTRQKTGIGLSKKCPYITLIEFFVMIIQKQLIHKMDLHPKSNSISLRQSIKTASSKPKRSLIINTTETCKNSDELIENINSLQSKENRLEVMSQLKSKTISHVLGSLALPKYSGKDKKKIDASQAYFVSKAGTGV